MNLDIIAFGEYTVRQCLYFVGVVVVAYMILKMIYKKFFAMNEDAKYSIFFNCENCGWSGKIGTYAKHCPKCNQPVH